MARKSTDKIFIFVLSSKMITVAEKVVPLELEYIKENENFISDY